VFQKLAVIGCGLMGGSFAMALRAAGQVAKVAGHSRSPSSSRRAVELGIIDEACEQAVEAVRGADLVLIAVPVGATQATLSALLPGLTPQALVMDVGSTKRDVVAAAQAALGKRVTQFVAAHPIAGKATGGIEQAEATLYQGRTTILTPLAETPADQLARARAAWESVGSLVVPMNAQAHDETFAAVSHLPHLLAFAYMQGLMSQGPAALRQHLTVAGPGFRDFSRIAGSTSAIWRDIFSANRDEVLTQLAHFEASLEKFRQALIEGRDDDLARWVDEASAVRSRWPGLPD
jgi:prephenate dehydrogenase